MDSDAELSFLNSEQELQRQLQVYKLLNKDLSKTIQNLRIELSQVTNQLTDELTKTQNELIEVKKMYTDLKRTFFAANTHCVNFLQAYTSTINEVNFNDESIHLQASDKLQIENEPKPNFPRLLNNSNQDLDPITEESQLPTSTPFQKNRFLQSNTVAVKRTFDSFSSIEELTPKKAKSVPNITSRRLSEEISTTEEESPAIEDQTHHFEVVAEVHHAANETLNTELPSEVIEQPAERVVKNVDKEDAEDVKMEENDGNESEQEKIPPKKKAKKEKKENEKTHVVRQAKARKEPKKVAKKVIAPLKEVADEDNTQEKDRKTAPKRKRTKKETYKEESDDENVGRSKRTKNRANYAEPTLKTKMRRD